MSLKVEPDKGRSFVRGTSTRMNTIIGQFLGLRAFLQALNPAMNIQVRFVSYPAWATENVCRSPAISNRDRSVTTTAKISIMIIDSGFKSTCVRFTGAIYVTPLTSIIAFTRSLLRIDVVAAVIIVQKRMKSAVST